ncbi:MAG: hypothetical protein ACRD9R_15855, partial [Pyrinomonadaceae bacterium]
FAGLALFATSNPNNFTHSNRLDAVSSTANVSTLFAEGSGLDYAAEYGATAGTQFSWARRLSSGTPQDTNDNAQDFALVSTVGPFSRAGGTLVPATLGAPGPENLASPVQRNGLIKAALLDPFASSAAPPNRARDFAPVANGPLGTLSVRRKFRNHTGQTLSRLRFRVVDLTTAPAPAGTADLRAVGSNAASLVITLSNGTTTVPVLGTQVETPPAQTLLLGGGLNSTLVTIAPAVPLAPGQLVNVEFRFGVGQTGRFRFLVNIEALP